MCAKCIFLSDANFTCCVDKGGGNDKDIQQSFWTHPHLSSRTSFWCSPWASPSRPPLSAGNTICSLLPAAGGHGLQGCQDGAAALSQPLLVHVQVQGPVLVHIHVRVLLDRMDGNHEKPSPRAQPCLLPEPDSKSVPSLQSHLHKLQGEGQWSSIGFATPGLAVKLLGRSISLLIYYSPSISLSLIFLPIIHLSFICHRCISSFFFLLYLCLQKLSLARRKTSPHFNSLLVPLPLKGSETYECMCTD